MDCDISGRTVLFVGWISRINFWEFEKFLNCPNCQYKIIKLQNCNLVRERLS